MKKRYEVLCSAFDRKGRLICTKKNEYTRSHPLQKMFAIKAGEPYKESLHAEIHALIRCGDNIPHRLVVMRYDSFGNLKNARPCLTCRTAIEFYGVKEVLYSTEEGMKRL